MAEGYEPQPIPEEPLISLSTATTMVNLFTNQKPWTVCWYYASNTDVITDITAGKRYNVTIMIAKDSTGAQVVIFGTQASNPYQYQTLRGAVDSSGFVSGAWV